MNRIASVFCIALVPAIGIGLAIALSSPQAPPVLASAARGDQEFASAGRSLPPLQFMAARDGQMLAHRYYPGRQGQGVAVIVHGSSGTSAAMHSVAQALSARGITSYAIDLRGHGASGPLGDIGHRGQLDEDMEDILRNMSERHKGERRLLVGHSMGGGFALHLASARQGLFDAFLAISPFITHQQPLSRSASGGWADAAVPRIIGLSLLNTVGISWFDGLPVIAYAMAPDASADRPRRYSHRLAGTMRLPRDWQSALRQIRQPVRILIGDRDELFNASAYPAALGPLNAGFEISVMPGLGHLDIILNGNAVAAVADAAGGLLH